MEKEIEVNGKKIVVKELKYKDLTKVANLPQEDLSKEVMKLSTNITDEEYDNLSMKDGLTIQKAVNDINGLENFQ